MGAVVPQWDYWPDRLVPRAWDIVWCRFPFDEAPDAPAPKPRPGLVLEVRRLRGVHFVFVAYGTSNLDRATPTTVTIANFSELVRAGLGRPTVFQLSRTRWIPWAREWAGKRRRSDASPIIGRLPESGIEQVQRLIALMSEDQD